MMTQIIPACMSLGVRVISEVLNTAKCIRETIGGFLINCLGCLMRVIFVKYLWVWGVIPLIVQTRSLNKVWLVSDQPGPRKQRNLIVPNNSKSSKWHG